MTKCFLHTPLAPLLLLLIFVTSCYGQSKTNPKYKEHAGNRATQLKALKSAPKIIRTHGIASGSVICQLQDKDGGLWFSIEGEGVYRYNGRSFTNFTTKNGLCSNYVNAIIQDRSGNILFGTSCGVCKYAASAASGTGSMHFTKYASTDTLRITCLLEDKDGNTWFGTMDNGIYRYDGKALTNFLNSDKYTLNLGARHQLIMYILQDKKGNLWFSSWNGGGVWRYDGRSFKNFLPAAGYYNSNEDQRSFANDQQRAFNNGLSMDRYVATTDNISDDMIFSMKEDGAGNIWFATRRHGACRYDGKSFISFGENEGFVSYGIYSILEDTKGNMWFGTDKNGVFCYDGKTFKNFTTRDGLVNDSVFSILEAKNGDIWFGTRWFGLSCFNGKSFTTFSD